MTQLKAELLQKQMLEDGKRFILASVADSRPRIIALAGGQRSMD
jgi:hypothetical protein